jgi:hypothetical protein
MCFDLRLKLQHLAALLSDIPLLPVQFALSLGQLEFFPMVERLLPAAILRLLLALHVALPSLNVGNNGPAG